MNLMSNRCSIGLAGCLAAACVALVSWTVTPLDAQSVTDTYRAAAQAYKEAAAKVPEPRRRCLLEWAKYYEDYAAAVQRGNGEPKRPTLDPGCSTSSADSSR